MFKVILDFVLMILAMVLMIFFTVFAVKTVKFILKDKAKIKNVKDLLHCLRDNRYPNLFEFIKWVAIDIKRGTLKYKIFGIWAFTGYFGEGKSLGAVDYALRIKKTYPFVHVFSNFTIVGQERKITDWHDILTLPKYSIVIWDEVHSDFNNLDYANFPVEFLRKITQCRKKKLAIFTISQVFSRMAIQLRENTDVVITCENKLGLDRWFKYTFYKADKYEKYYEDPDLLKKHKMYSYTLIAQDANYNAYDTEEEIVRVQGIQENQKVKGLSKNDVIKICEYEFKKYAKELQVTSKL